MYREDNMRSDADKHSGDRHGAGCHSLSKITALIVAMFVLSPSIAPAATYVVNPCGSGDFPTIQTAIDNAADGDVIELTDGVFFGDGNRDIVYKGIALTVRSQSGNPQVCVIDCGWSDTDSHRGFLFRSNDGPDAVLEGVTVTGGDLSEPDVLDDGGAVLCIRRASPTFVNCWFTENRALKGAAVCCRGTSSPKFIDCVFSSNSACGLIGGGQGGGLYCENGAAPVLQRCVFYDNSAYYGGGLHCSGLASPILEHCTFLFNSGAHLGGAINCAGATPRISNCTIYGGGALGFGGGIAWFSDQSGSITNTIIAFVQEGGSFRCGDSPPPTLTCCNIYGNVGGNWIDCIADQASIQGNFSADPLFCDPYHGDFTLHANSPCLPGCHPDGVDCGLIGAQNQGCAATAVESGFEVTSWARIKAAYRLGTRLP